MKYCELCGNPVERTEIHNNYSFTLKKFCSKECRVASECLDMFVSVCKKKGIKVSILRFNDYSLRIAFSVLDLKPVTSTQVLEEL